MMAGERLSFQITFIVLTLLSLEVKGLDHGGSSFYITFLPLPVSDGVDEMKLYCASPESVPVTFTVSAPGIGFFQTATVDPGSVKEFTFIGQKYALRNTTDRSKGIIITAKDEKHVFVYAAQKVLGGTTTSSFLALPPHDLGASSYTYIAAMIHTLDRGSFGAGITDIHAVIGIVSAENNTLLNIRPTRDVAIGTELIKAGESIDVTLHRAETLLIKSVGDLTGTKVTSNRSISVFSGDQCTYVPSGVAACDQIVEQLPPVEAWGRQFATVPLKTRMSFDVFRVVAAEDSTMVNISCTLHNGTKGNVDTYSLNESSFVDVHISSTDYCWMEADKRILLLQFAVGSFADNVPSDPFMALVPAVSHYTNSFTLPVVQSSMINFTHYLNIIIPTEHYQPDQIFLDGQSLHSLALECVAITHNGQTMAYGCQVEVNATTHTLTHGNSRGVFGVISYGFAYRVSYGHIGGMRLPQFSIEPLAPPTELTVRDISSTSFTVSWRPPLGDMENGNTLYYHVNVTDNEGEGVIMIAHNRSVLQLRVAELLPDHVYQVSVAAVSGNRVGPPVTLLIRTSPHAASIITIGTVLAILLLIASIFTVVTCASICLCVCISRRKREGTDTEGAPPDTAGEGTQVYYVHLEENPAYESMYI